MGESDSECVQDHIYRNCIIVDRNEDSDSDTSMDTSTSTTAMNAPGGSKAKDSNDTFQKLTCDQITKVDLSLDETFVFMLGILDRIENYTEKGNLSEDLSRDWLRHKLQLLKTIIFKTCNTLETKNALKEREHHIRDATSVLNNGKHSSKGATSGKNKTQQKTKAKTLTTSKFQEVQGAHLDEEPETIDTNVPIDAPSEELTPKNRRSLPRSCTKKKIPSYMLARMSYVYTKKHQKGSPMSEMEYVGDFNKSHNTANNTANKKPANRRAKSLGAPSKKNNTATPKVANSATTKPKKGRKRRAASLDGGIKKRAKQDAGPSTSRPSVGKTNSSLNNTKRSLYSENEWLEVLNSTPVSTD